MSAAALDVGRLACTFTKGTAVIAAFTRAAIAGGVSAFFVFGHRTSRRLDSIAQESSTEKQNVPARVD
jgi:hypothetical protein